MKSPLEFVVSSIRALDGSVRIGLPLARALEQLGMPLYMCQPPTGYSDRADTWVSGGGLLTRMNIAVALVSGQVPGVFVDVSPLDVRLGRDVQEVMQALDLDDVSATTRSIVDEATSADLVAALLLGSPEFQRQ